MAFWKNENMIEKKDPGRDSCEDDSQEREEIEEIEEMEEVEEVDNDSLNEEEINSLNMQLDELNHALDKLEQKNDDLNAQLVVLLEANKQAREYFLQIREKNCDSDDKNDDS